MSINDGGSAFPYAAYGENGERSLCRGMTLRQWYAGKALQGILANPNNTAPSKFAEFSFDFADKMIREEQND